MIFKPYKDQATWTAKPLDPLTHRNQASMSTLMGEFEWYVRASGSKHLAVMSRRSFGLGASPVFVASPYSDGKLRNPQEQDAGALAIKVILRDPKGTEAYVSILWGYPYLIGLHSGYPYP